MAGGVLQDAADLARIYLHSAAMGIPEYAERKFGNPANADRSDAALAQARQNTGLAGSAANIAGYFSPGGALSLGAKAVKAAPKVLRAIPAAERAIGAAINPARANFYARLGLGEVPTFTGSLGKIPGRIAASAKAHPVKAAAVGLGIPALALADDYGTNGPSSAAAAPKQATTAKKAPAAAAAAEQVAPSPWEAIMGAVAKQQGGKISLDQLGAIADFTNKISPEIRRPPTYKDAAAEQLSTIAEQRWAQTQQQAKILQAQGDMEGARSVLLQGMDQASRDYGVILGQDPQSMLYAQRMQELNQGD